MTSKIVSEISYPSSAAIGGNYSNDDRTLTGENFTVGGDTTITNCDVLLATSTPQDSINLTWDNDATITGTQGSLIFGSMMQAPVMDVATVSSGATISNGVTFPAGMIIKISHNELECNETNKTNVTAYRSWTATNLTCSHTTALASAILLVEYHMQYHTFQEQTGQDTFGNTRIYDNRTGSYAESTTNSDGTNVGGRQMTTGWWNIDQGSLVAKRKITLTGIAAGTTVTFKVYGYKFSSNDSDGYVQYNGIGSFSPPYGGGFTSTMTITELSG